jgi:cyclopropane-fatty-acyl-phospholipid synthase
MVDHGEKSGFTVPEVLSLRPHYIRTLDIWGSSLEAKHDDAVAITSEEVYLRYVKYLRGCQKLFTDEYCDVNLVTYAKAG